MTRFEKCWGIAKGKFLVLSQTFSPINNPAFLKPSPSSYLPAYEDGTECSETPIFKAYKIQTPGNYPEESTQHSEHGKSLKSRVELSIFISVT